MPVYERGYTSWQPSGRQAYPPWWVIARRGIVGPLRKRGLLFLLVLAWIPAVVKGTIIFVKARTGDLLDLVGGNWTSIAPGGFLAFLEGQRFFVFLLLALVGAGLVAVDRRENGLSLYFSRPLNLVDYVAGKLLIVLFTYLLVTLAPVYALCFFGYLVGSGATGAEMLLQIPAQATVYALYTGSSMGLVLLAMSSLGKRAIFVTVWWTILFMGSEAVSSLVTVAGLDGLQAVNFAGQYHNAGALIFGAAPRLAISPWLSLALTLGYAALAVAVLHRRIRPVEVVS
ncbi:MAG: hypothetical protein R6X25_13725 [Candidatus Krumholzibacteriia bacterium]